MSIIKVDFEKRAKKKPLKPVESYTEYLVETSSGKHRRMRATDGTDFPVIEKALVEDENVLTIYKYTVEIKQLK